MSDWRQELIDFINAKAKEHADMPMNKLGYFRLMEQLARHQANHVAAKLQSEHWTYSPDNQPVDYLINPTLAEDFLDDYPRAAAAAQERLGEMFPSEDEP